VSAVGALCDQVGSVVTGAYSLEGAHGALCVLASGSSGNCSVLVTRTADGGRHVSLIDLGLSPRRTRKCLEARGLSLDQVDEVLLTHLDTDHCHPGWVAAMRRDDWRARLNIHRKHMGRAERAGLLCAHAAPFDDVVELHGGASAHVCVMSHDSLGVACFRVEIEHGGAVAALGYATDCGRVTASMIEHLRGVDTLALESNYDPEMQVRSGRPAALKKRIMGGSGHLSNQLSADAVRRIGVRDHLVLLHLSRQCNTPELCAIEHAHEGVTRTISTQFEMTAWIPVRAGAGSVRRRRSVPLEQVQGELFARGARERDRV
jgi:phosphoribosyl 1,2-cyclic phosphodiesterase